MMTSSEKLNSVRPWANVLPEPVADDVFTSEQWTTLLAIADTIIPGIRPASQPTSSSHLSMPDEEYRVYIRELLDSLPNPPESNVLESFVGESATSNEAFRRELHHTFAFNVRDDARKGVSFLLNTLNTRVGGLLFNGSMKPFHEHTLSDRTSILTNWGQSYLPPIKQFQQSLMMLIKGTWARTSPNIGPAIDFPRHPVHGSTGRRFEFNFLRLQPGSEPDIIETDVIIIGSGCGAGVVAKNIAEDGHRVLVVDKGYYHPPETLPMTELDASKHLYHGGIIQPSDDSSITVVAGSNWGGGGTVNWSASLQTQGFVRQEWADKGLSLFTSADYQACLDRVCQRMGVSTDHIEHNHANRFLLEGARRLGYSVRPVPQNTGGNKHYCGYCTLGCRAGEKQGPAVSWLPDAANAGAKFMEGFEVDKVLFEKRAGAKVATGVQGTWKSRDGSATRQVIVRAKKTCVSAGTLFSPLILLRSGLKNSQIGQNLKLHPANWVFGVWPEEIKPWEGGILTTVSDEFQNLDSQGHGTKLECTILLPSFVYPLFPGFGPELKRTALKVKRMCGFISLVRDRDSGKVYPDPTSGLPRFNYSPSAIDRQHSLEGLVALAKICYVTGAKEIFTTLDGVPTFVRSNNVSSKDESPEDAGINDPDFQAWLTKLRSHGMPTGTVWASAHQMGTCRMGINERDSVVNQKGQVWGTENLYVADASVFPSASGVNPMITNMAISDWISRGLAKELRREARGSGQQPSL